jgi:nitrate/nitrite transporter NarK
VFGAENYGYRLGILGAPARILQAAAPISFGLLIDRFGAHALVFSSLICLAAMAALLAVAVSQHEHAKD